MHMPRIGAGTFRLQGQAAVDSAANALALGYRHIDTAQIYGNEAEVGQALAASGVARDQVFVTTKVWTAHLKADALIPSLKESLRKLGLERLDLALVHWPSPGGAVPLAETMAALLEARALGLTDAIGVSNFTVALLDEALRTVPAADIATNQVELHPYLQNRRLLAHMRTLGIHATAYMPLAFGKVIDDPTIAAIAARLEATPAQVTLAWLLARGHTVIPSSTRRAHLAANLAAGRLLLDQADLAAIDALERGERLVDPDFAPRWD